MKNNKTKIIKKNDLPLISIIVVNFNGRNYLEETLPVLCDLDYPLYEIIVVDNGSSDGSLDFIKTFRNIRLLLSPRYREKNYACNYAIEHSRGEYVLLLDNDVIIVDSGILIRLLETCSAIPRIGAIGLAVHDRDIALSGRYGSYFGYYFIREVKKIPVDDVRQYHGLNIPATGGQIFIKKSLWRTIGGYDEHLPFGGDDNDLGIRLTLHGYMNCLYSETNQLHIGLAERQNNTKYAKKFRDSFYANLYTIVKNYRLVNLVPTMFIYPAFTLLKGFRQAIIRKSIGPMLAFFHGYWLFLKNLRHALAKRKIIQQSRTVKKDIFITRPERLNRKTC